jgi:predicted secreted protein
VNQPNRVDVFGACDKLNLWVVTGALDKLLGVYLPQGGGGMLLTTQRQQTVQRYTAAHEIGHWALGHQGFTLDTETDVLGSTDKESEQLAQIFAGQFLLPVPLVLDSLDRMGYDGQLVTPVQAYGVAREAGVSYEAAVRQLHNMEYVSRTHMTELLNVSPLSIKTQVGHGDRPVNGRADVWAVDENWDGQTLDLLQDDEIVVSLPENRTTGFRWISAADDAQRLASINEPPASEPLPLGQETSTPDDHKKPAELVTPISQSASSTVVPIAGTRFADSAMLELVSERYVSNSSDEIDSGRHEHQGDLFKEKREFAVGAGGRRLLRLRAAEPGNALTMFRYALPFDPTCETEGAFAIRALVSGPPPSVPFERLVREARLDEVEAAFGPEGF